MGRIIFIEEDYSVLVVARIIAFTWYLKFSEQDVEYIWVGVLLP